ncbi:hypothetical protein ECG_02678 [Echinococcus granulosus]|nr:hypothetical protein ECG_02678 [Echinococcus granulosus]
MASEDNNLVEDCSLLLGIGKLCVQADEKRTRRSRESLLRTFVVCANAFTVRRFVSVCDRKQSIGRLFVTFRVVIEIVASVAQNYAQYYG